MKEAFTERKLYKFYTIQNDVKEAGTICTTTFGIKSLPSCLMHLPDTVGTAINNWKASCDPGYGVDRVAPTAEVNSTNYCNEEKTQKTWG